MNTLIQYLKSAFLGEFLYRILTSSAKRPTISHKDSFETAVKLEFINKQTKGLLKTEYGTAIITVVMH